MNRLKKLALVSAITAASFSAQALEVLEDDALSEVTGQEGITIDRSYRQAIEEFKYVDADGDGVGGSGEISIKGLLVGDFTDSNLFFGAPTPMGGVGEIAVNGITIDATENGVLINHGYVGTAGGTGVNLNGTIKIAPETDGSGLIAMTKACDPTFGCTVDTTLDDYGVTVDKATFVGSGNGLDMRMEGAYIGKVDGSGQGKIGSFTLLNAGSYVGSTGIYVMVDKYGVAGGRSNILASSAGSLTQATELFNNSANTWITRETRYSSKNNGTGIHIETENSNGIGGQAVYYTDTDGTGGNQIGVYSMSTFRLATADELGDNQDMATGTFLRPGYTEYDLDVDDGKLVMSNMIKSSSTLMNQIFIGDIVSATDPINPTGIIGSMALFGNRWEGTQKIYAH